MTQQRRVSDISGRDAVSASKIRALQLFNNQRVGNMGPDLYTNGGSDKYTSVISKSEEYIPYQGEVALIQESKEAIAKWAKDIDTVIIIGPGPSQAIDTKEIPILKLLPKLKTVKLIDLSEQFNQEATASLEKAFPKGVIVETYAGDFHTVTPNQNYSKALVITTGSLTNFEDAPFENFPSAIAGSYLRRFHELAKPGGKIIWGYDSNSELESLEAEYDTPEIAEFILNPLKKLSTLAGVKLDPSKFTYSPQFHSRGSHLAHYWMATDNQVAEIDGETINLFEGERFACFSSIKLNPQRLNIIANTQGLKTFKSFSHDTSKQILHCFDCN